MPYVRALALVVAFLVTTAPALAAFTVSGSFYQYVAGSSRSPAVSGAKVFIRPVNGDAKSEIGPSVTDAYGRFTFTGVTPGSYVLRAYVGTSLVWQQTLPVSKTIVLAPVVVTLPPST